MKNIYFLFIVLVFLGACNNNTTNKEAQKEMDKDMLVDSVFKLAESQYKILIDSAKAQEKLWMPRTLKPDGSIVFIPKEDWTSGFFPGSLWYLYEYTGNEFWKSEAIEFTEALDSAQYIKWNHDVGFMIGCSYGNAYRLTKDTTYINIIIDAAKSLSTRYRPIAKVIQSWDTDLGWVAEKGWDMPVIIDNMMNLDIMFKATKFTGDSSYYDISVNHSNTTILNHFRDNYSSYHIIDYDHTTGKVLHKHTGQGYAHETSWARGQAWGLYGFTETYRNTGDKKFLNQAIAIANYIINSEKIPSDNIPYWDYDDPKIPDAPRDASAAAITSSALLELMHFDKENSSKYLSYAEKILRSLSTSEYLAGRGENGGFLLKKSVGNIHTGEDVSNALNYADYYYLEALLRWKNI